MDVSPTQKLGFARDAIAKGYTLAVFDLERLRSLFDTSLKDVRRRYLGIDDEVAARLRSEITRLLRFPDAVEDTSQSSTLLEGLLVNKLPRRLFDVLLTYEERDVREVPGIGQALQEHLKNYYDFRKRALGPAGSAQHVLCWMWLSGLTRQMSRALPRHDRTRPSSASAPFGG